MKSIIFSILTATLLLGCNNDDTSQQTNSFWVGNWKLISYSQNGFSQTLHYNQDDIVWRILENNTIEANIASNLNLPHQLPIVESGVYNYQTNQNNEIYFVDISKAYFMYLKNDTLYLNYERYSDGEQIILTK